MKEILYKILIRIFPSFFFQFQHFRIHKTYGSHSYWANLRKPLTFNEHILSRKMLPFKKDLNGLVDKYLVKEYVRDTIGESYVIPTYLYYADGDQIEVDQISFPCIMKPTHLSGYTKVFRSREEFNSFNFRAYADKMLKKNLFRGTGELQYKDVCPGILFEKLLTDDTGELKDYKFFCFYGKVKAIQVDFNRYTNHARTFMSPEWENLRFSSLYKLYEGEVKKPENLDVMISIAEELSKPHDFVRVDLYNVNGSIYFGELTFDHGSGYEPFTTKRDDIWLGSHFVNHKH